LVVGVHADDIAIGCGGTILRLPPATCRCTSLGRPGAAGRPGTEAVSSAAAFLKDVEQTALVLKAFRDGFFPWTGAEVKEVFEDLKGTFAPDLVIVPCRDDAHQDHRLVAELTWNTFRDHLVLEYKIQVRRRSWEPKPVSCRYREPACGRWNCSWSSSPVSTTAAGLPLTPWAWLRLCGMESNAPSGYVEVFHTRKATMGPPASDAQ
jgi:LmbE family N-acetylglucosaminyl deacetylase